MEQSSLVKWVDELQGQIDELKRTGGNDAALAARIAALETGVTALETAVNEVHFFNGVVQGLSDELAEGIIAFDVVVPVKYSDYRFDSYVYLHVADGADTDILYEAPFGDSYLPVTKIDLSTGDESFALSGAVHAMISTEASGTANTAVTFTLEEIGDAGFNVLNTISAEYVIIARKISTTTKNRRK